MIRLMLVDDHKVLRIGLASLFQTVPSVEVVGEAGNAEEAVDVALRTEPDVVLMDVRLPDGDGVEATRAIMSERPQTRIIMLTSYPDEDAVIASIMAGAAGYLLKQTDPERLIEAVERVAAGASLLDPDVTRSALEFMRHGGSSQNDDSLAGLSDQERRILPLIAEGKTNREIGAELSLSPHTVKTYVSSIFQKLHLARRSQAAAFVGRSNQHTRR
ncbi:MAG TPA: response regulator transcription factor [Chloroflexota bacterium]|nr:response regulator transcription factor [Chloroflexota bacterium]